MTQLFKLALAIPRKHTSFIEAKCSHEKKAKNKKPFSINYIQTTKLILLFFCLWFQWKFVFFILLVEKISLGIRRVCIWLTALSSIQYQYFVPWVGLCSFPLPFFVDSQNLRAQTGRDGASRRIHVLWLDREDLWDQFGEEPDSEKRTEQTFRHTRCKFNIFSSSFWVFLAKVLKVRENVLEEWITPLVKWQSVNRII